MIFGSVCSGIEAASQAWAPLGWKPAFLSEIEEFPRAVLKHHYPEVPLHGDFTTIQKGDYEDIDLLCGGTPCQAFSIAGKGGGLDDDRGKLSVEFCRLAVRLSSRWVAWENVPNSFSIEDGRAFAAILSGLAGWAVPVPEGGWKSAGVISGRPDRYGLAWRVIDAQYAIVDGYPSAVPQRRSRIVLIGYLGDWRRAAAVLFEPESLQRDPPARRKAGQGVAGTLGGSAQDGGFRTTDLDNNGAFIAEAPVAGTVSAKWSKGSGGPSGDECQNLVAFDPVQVTTPDNRSTGRGDTCHAIAAQEKSAAVAYSIQERASAENDECGPGGAGFSDDGAAYTLEARRTSQAVAFSVRGREGGASAEAEADDISPALKAADGGSTQPFIAFSSKDYAQDASGETAPTLRAMANDKSRMNAGGQIAVAHTLTGEGFDASEDGTRRGTPLVPDQWRVRRLTTVECERLQGFPDNFTRIPWKGKPAEQCPDGHRYKALGNSWAVNVFRWVGMRIDIVDRIPIIEGWQHGEGKDFCGVEP